MRRAAARMRLVVCAVALAGVITAAPAAADPPQVSYALFGTQGTGGWYTSDVTIVWTVDVTNGPMPYDSDGCPASEKISADTTPTGITRTCTASNGDGTTIRPTPTIRRDATKPTITGASGARGPDRDGWFNHPVAVTFAGSDAASGIASCTATSYDAPDAAGTSVTGTCRDAAGNLSAPSSFPLKYDATPPQVSGLTPERPADAFGYFLRPVALAFTGSDATSGLLGCDTVTYAGPDSPAGAVTGSCRDVAGNAASRTLAVAFDATPPALTKLRALAGDSVATLSWEASTDATSVSLRRRPGPAAPVYEGTGRSFQDRGLKNGTRYRYTLAARDAAGHETTRTIAAAPSAKLIAPAAGASVKAPPRLSWKRVAKARYYNVQLFRGKHKILSAWPLRTRLQLRSAWRFGGRWQRLSPGTYRWYVWPGYGDRGQRRYGRVLGSRTFTLP